VASGESVKYTIVINYTNKVLEKPESGLLPITAMHCHTEGISQGELPRRYMDETKEDLTNMVISI